MVLLIQDSGIREVRVSLTNFLLVVTRSSMFHWIRSVGEQHRDGVNSFLIDQRYGSVCVWLEGQNVSIFLFGWRMR